MTQSTLLSMILFVIITSGNHHHCIHDQIKHHDLLQSFVQYQSISFNNVNLNHLRRKLAIFDTNNYEPIRMRPYWTGLELSTEISTKEIKIIKNLISVAIKYFESFIKVIPSNGPLYYPRQCESYTDESRPTITRSYSNCMKYASKTQCGAIEIPSTHFRQDWKYYQDGAVNTEEYPAGNGIINTDLVLYVSASTLFCDNSKDGLVWSIPCVQDQNGRPIFANINFCPFKDIKHDIYYIMITIHELTHILGFSSLLYSSFIDKYGETLGFDNVIASNIQSINGDIINKWVITPKVKSVAQTYFNCTEIIGVPLEDDDGDSIPSHWEEHFLNGEYMMAYPDKKMSYVSNLTLAFLQDTGWYIVDFDYAEPQFQFGKNYGCKFFQNECFNVSDLKNESDSNFKEYFCNPNVMTGEYCTFDHVSIGFCGVSLQTPYDDRYKYFGDDVNTYYGWITSEYCPYVEVLDSNVTGFNFQCFEPNGNSFDHFSSSYAPWNYSLSSRCINTQTSLIIDDYGNDTNETMIKWEQTAFCFPVFCNKYDMESRKWSNIDIIIGEYASVQCYRKDIFQSKSVIIDNYMYTIECPNIDTICINKKPFECKYGAWNDELNKCICKAGFEGDSCENKLEIIVDSLVEYNGTWNQIPYQNDLCGIVIDNDIYINETWIYHYYPLINGTWIYKGYDTSNTTVYPYYINGDYYLYFDTKYHLWNIGTNLNDEYTEMTVIALCDIGERPYDVMDCSHSFYFSDEIHYEWMQNLNFVLLHENCNNKTTICSYCEDFDVSQWTINTFYIPTSSPTMMTSTVDFNITNETINHSHNQSDTVINESLVIIVVFGVILLLMFMIGFGIYCYHKVHTEKLNKQLKYVKQDLVDETVNHKNEKVRDGNVSECVKPFNEQNL